MDWSGFEPQRVKTMLVEQSQAAPVSPVSWMRRRNEADGPGSFRDAAIRLPSYPIEGDSPSYVGNRILDLRPPESWIGAAKTPSAEQVRGIAYRLIQKPRRLRRA
jgi:hypothetical protein